MNHPWLVEAWLPEAALRSLVMGATIFIVLKALRIRQVRAQRTAWVLALLAAVLMPAMGHWPIGPGVLQTRVLPWLQTPALPPTALRPLPATEASAVEEGAIRRLPALNEGLRQNQPAASLIATSNATPIAQTEVALPARARFAQRAEARFRSILQAATVNITASVPYTLAAYSCVAFIFLVRLATGLVLALRLRRQAVVAPWYFGAARHGDDIRISARLHTPATIASSIVLPESSADWDAAKLRMVLAHERTHVQQADFYIQLLAGLHCAIFWFSPFSWWLQRRLSALGEAMSDLAALQQAESRSSYAEVLLEFATAARQPMAAVSMARSSNLRPRIERLLNDQLFREAISAKRRHPFLAASIVPVALLVSASLVRVHAATVQQAAVPATAASAAPAATPKPAATIPADAEQAAAPASAAEPEDASRAADSIAPVAPTAPDAAARAAWAAARANEDKFWVQQQAAGAQSLIAQSAMDAARLQMLRSRVDLASQVAAAVQNSYMYGDWDGGAFALVTGDDSYNYSFNGGWNKLGRFDAIRRETKGDFIYYEHDGKAYVIQDPALIAKAKELYAPMTELGKRQEELGRQQEALGKQQEELGHQQESVKLPTPDLSKELASLDHAIQELKELQSSKEATQESLAGLQGEIGEIQGQLGELQLRAGDQMGKLGEQMGALGAQQGKLGAEQGRLGAQQGKIAGEAQRKMKPLLDQAIKDGRAKPIE